MMNRGGADAGAFSIVWPCVLVLFILGQYWGVATLTSLRAAPNNLAIDHLQNHLDTRVESPADSVSRQMKEELHRVNPHNEQSDQALEHVKPKNSLRGIEDTEGYVSQVKEEGVGKKSLSFPDQREEDLAPQHNLRGSAPVESGRALGKSFHSEEDAAMTTPFGLDDLRISVGVWVKLDSGKSYDTNMRTILSNKQSGCEAHEGQYGFSLYVNGWDSSDHHLYLEYGSVRSGCHKLEASAFEFKADEWTHVGALLEYDSSALYINGNRVAEMTHTSSTGTAPPHEVNRAAFTVGMYDLEHFPFHGNIAHLAFTKLPHEVDLNSANAIMKSLMTDTLLPPDKAVKNIPGIIAYFSLDDEHGSHTGAKAHNFVGNFNNRPAEFLPRGSVEVGNSKLVGDGIYRFGGSGIAGKEAFGLKVPLNDGLGSDYIQQDHSSYNSKGSQRANAIKNSMKTAWGYYKQYAWGRDELKPISKQPSDNWGGMGVTLIDSLDTLWIMGLTDEFNDARDWVKNSLTYKHANTVSVFETTIRVLGGLLSAYDFSKDKCFLDKAQELGEKLSKAFSTSSGLPSGQVSMQSGHTSNGWMGNSAILSEVGSLQLEFRNLAMYSGQQKYEEISMRPLSFLNARYPKNGLLGIKLDIASGRPTDSTITLGALGDSFYEYLLKVWIQGGKKENWLRKMYDTSIDGVMDILLARSTPDNLVFVADWNGRTQHRKMDHLVCFLPGVLALGAHTDPTGSDSERAQRDMAVAKSLMYTCYQMYHSTKTGIAPEFVEFPPGRGMTVGSQAPFYILRPETAESLFVLAQLTGDPIYREWSWQIWSAIQKNCKVPYGFGSLRDVRKQGGGIDDRMESFFFAETMKYLYLAQQPEKIIDLDEYVFNTEAHPTRIFKENHVPVQGKA